MVARSELRRAAAMSVAVPVGPAAGLSAATGGALALGAVGVLGAAGGSGLTCLFAAATGLDCPFCGLTHGVAALGAGDLEGAVAANPLAPLAVGLALAVAVALVRGRRRDTAPTQRWSS
jgi:uncharacterized protein DUF2752